MELLRIENGKLLLDNCRIGNDINVPGFEKYEFEEELGRGANGAVFRVKHSLLGIYQVVKIYFPKDEEDIVLTKAQYEAIKNADNKLNGIVAVE